MCKSQRSDEREEGVDDDRRREASLMILAISGSAIVGMCMVTCCQGSRGRSGWDIKGGIRERQKETG